MKSSRLFNRYTLLALCILPVLALWVWGQLYPHTPKLSPAELAQHIQQAKGGNKNAIEALVIHYSFSAPGNPQQARYWMQQAADKGMSRWQYTLGNDLLREGKVAKGCHYVQLAAAQGEQGARALLAASPACSSQPHPKP